MPLLPRPITHKLLRAYELWVERSIGLEKGELAQRAAHELRAILRLASFVIPPIPMSETQSVVFNTRRMAWLKQDISILTQDYDRAGRWDAETAQRICVERTQAERIDHIVQTEIEGWRLACYSPMQLDLEDNPLSAFRAASTRRERHNNNSKVSRNSRAKKPRAESV